MTVEVRLRPSLHGCMFWPLTLMTLGLFALLKSMGEKHFIARMDENGIETRGGVRIGWQEFTFVEHVRGVMKRNILSDEYILKSPKGKVSLPFWRAENAQEAKDFLLRHLPPNLLENRA